MEEKETSIQSEAKEPTDNDTQDQDSAASSETTNHDHLEHGADAINTLAVIGSLMFGFGVSIWFNNISQEFENNTTAYIVYLVFLSIAISGSGFTTIAMTAHYYAVRLYLQSIHLNNGVVYHEYMNSTHFVRVWSRYSLCLSFISFYIVMIIYIYVINGIDDNHQIIASVLSSIVYVIVMILSLYVVYHSFGSVSTTELKRKIRRRTTFSKSGKQDEMDKMIAMQRIRYLHKRAGTVNLEYRRSMQLRAPSDIMDDLIKYYKELPQLLDQVWKDTINYDKIFYLDGLLYYACKLYVKNNEVNVKPIDDLVYEGSFGKFASWVEKEIGMEISKRMFNEKFVEWMVKYKATR